eukprot:5446146-Alexandrium_andersonii.AAC.1
MAVQLSVGPEGARAPPPAARRTAGRSAAVVPSPLDATGSRGTAGAASSISPSMQDALPPLFSNYCK